MNLTVGVTGHRDLVASEVPALRNQVRAFFVDLKASFPGLDLQLLSPLAEGSDQLVAEVALELGIPLVVPLPMSQADYEKDFSHDAALDQFRNLLEHAEIIPLPLATDRPEPTDAAEASEREMQYMQVGVFVSNHCQVLLALWDGKVGGEPGGTSTVVNYHLTGVMPGYSISEESPNLLADNENDLVHHLVVSRDRPDGMPADGLNPGEASWLTAHFKRSTGPHMPAEYRDMLLRLEEFNADHQKYEQTIFEECSGLLEGVPDLQLPGGIDFVNRLFSHTDWLAVHFQKRFNQGMLWTHALAVIMGIVFIVYAEFDAAQWVLYLFLALFLAGVIIFAIGEHRQWHRKYLDYRALAEGLRVQLYWNLAGVVETRSAIFAYDNFLQKQDVDLGWIRHVMRSASLRRDRIHPPDPAWVEWVTRQWIGEPDGDIGQLAYYRRRSEVKSANYRRTTRLASISLWLGISFAIILVVATGRMSEYQRQLLLVLMGVLPLVAGVRDTYSHKKAERELIKQYRFMGQVFSNARRLLSGSTDLKFRRRVLKAVGNAALEEHAEWLLMHRERPLEHGGLG
ncbi:MAG: hypothetical protein HKN58_04070 [Xanthomonadales bacterium]|nr:hypothetical protein [Xanthomonadales bacterium]